MEKLQVLHESINGLKANVLVFCLVFSFLLCGGCERSPSMLIQCQNCVQFGLTEKKNLH